MATIEEIKTKYQADAVKAGAKNANAKNSSDLQAFLRKKKDLESKFVKAANDLRKICREIAKADPGNENGDFRRICESVAYNL